MTLTAWTSVAVYALLCIFAGRGVLDLYRIPKHPMTHNWASSYLAGQLVILLLTLLTAFTPLRLTWLQAGLGIAALLYGAWYAFRSRCELVRMILVGLTAFLVAGIIFPDVWLVTQYAPLYEWDARSYWFFHGKVIWHDNGIRAEFFANPDNAWSHCDYPLFLASQAAWLSTIVGEWNEIAAKAFLWINFAAYLDLFRRVLQRGCDRWWFWVPATVVVFDQETYSYVSGIADPHYAMPLILLAATWCTGSGTSPAFAALMLALAANMKNEAAVYVALILAVTTTVRLLLPAVRGRGRDAARAILANAQQIGLALLVGCAPWLIWSAYRYVHAIAERDRIMARMLDGHTFFLNLPQRALPILSYFADNYMFRRAPILLAALVLVVLFRRLRCRTTDAAHAAHAGTTRAYLWIAFVTLNVLIFLPYVVTSWDLALHLGTSAGRLLLLPFLLLVLILIQEVRLTILRFLSPPSDPAG